MIEKFSDAASMLWMNLDERERQIVMYALLYATIAVLSAFRDARKERLKRELREEITRGAG